MSVTLPTKRDSAFEGIHAALVTPFDAEERIDEDVLSALIEDLLGNGIRGIAVNGSTGEFPALTVEERKRCVQVACTVVGGRVPVTVQVGAMRTTEALEHAHHAAEQGATCLLVVSPYYEALGEEELLAYFQAIAGVGLPIMIYNNPAATGWSMTPELISRLSDIEQVRYLKDTTGDARRLFRIQQLCDHRLELLNGQDTLALLGFLAGARGTVWGAPNATPKECVKLWELTVASPDLERARRLWDAFYPVNRFFEEEGYVAAVKSATTMRGIDVGAPRRPILPLAPARAHELRRLVEHLHDVVASL
jgi:4-hydroxy-tetrahydrodipicolinate synthase